MFMVVHEMEIENSLVFIFQCIIDGECTIVMEIGKMPYFRQWETSVEYETFQRLQ